MEATRLIAVRHGETAWNADARIQGHRDIPLNAQGLWQARQLAGALAEEPVAAIYSSDLSRAWQTAEAIAARLERPIHAEPRLRERAFGSFEGRTFQEIERSQPEDALLWRRRDPSFAPGGGENLLHFRDRVLAVVADIASRHLDALVVLVAHGGLMDVLYRAATGQEIQAPRTWQLGNAAINRLLWTPQGLTLVGWGDTAHFEGAARDDLGV